MVMFNLKRDFSSGERSSMIDSAVKSLDADLEIVSSEGDILRANFYLISKDSPLLKSLFPTDKSAPARIHLPDVSKVVISHLINIVKHGFTTGQGPANSIETEIQEAARILGFIKLPVLTYDDEGEGEEMSKSSQTFDEGDAEIKEETQKEHHSELENALNDVNYIGKRYENDVEMSEIRRKIAEMELKVDRWVKGQKKMAKAEREEGMKLVFALDGIMINEENRNIRKSLVNKIQAVQDIDDAFIKKIQKVTSEAGVIPTEKSLRDVNKNMANSQNDESVEVTDTTEEKKKAKNEDTSWKFKKLNIDDDLMINSEDGNEQGEADSQDDMEQNDDDLMIIREDGIEQGEVDGQDDMEQDLVMKKKCNVLLDKKWITPGEENLLILAKKTNEKLDEMQTEKANLKRSKNRINSKQNIEPPMFSAAKRRGVLSKPEENEIEIKDKFHNNCEVREAITYVIKVDSDTGEDVTNGENGNIVPIPCAACKKVLTNASSLLVHCEKHWGSKGTRFCPYPFCAYSGTRTDMLKHFRAKHTKEKLFKCNSCDERFSSCQMLKGHVKNIH